MSANLLEKETENLTKVFSGLSQAARNALGLIALDTKLVELFSTDAEKAWGELSRRVGNLTDQDKATMTALYNTFLAPGTSTNLGPLMGGCWVDCQNPR